MRVPGGSRGLPRIADCRGLGRWDATWCSGPTEIHYDDTRKDRSYCVGQD